MSKLQFLDPLKPLDQSLILKSPKRIESSKNSNLEQNSNLDLFKPINVFGDLDSSKDVKRPEILKLPEAPDIKKLSIPDYKNRSPRSLRFMNLKDFKNEEAKKSRRMNPLYYKTRDMHTSYNSLMNKLYPNESKNKDLESVDSISEDPQNEDPQNTFEFLKCPDNPKDFSGSETSLNISGRSSKNSLQDYLNNLEALETYTDHSLSVNPKNYDLEDSVIEIIDDPNLTKKKCMVWWEGETIPYGKFRQNPDNIIFVVGEDAYGYSKKILFEEYQETVKRKVKNSLNSQDVSRESKGIYFDLNLNWEDNETLWIPLNQVLRILEYSHPVYEIQKMKYSIHVWNLVPVRLK
jgi:hypothetical protein